MFLDKRSSGPLAQLVEQLTFNQWVTGSNPVRLTTEINDLAGFGTDSNWSKLIVPGLFPDKYKYIGYLCSCSEIQKPLNHDASKQKYIWKPYC